MTGLNFPGTEKILSDLLDKRIPAVIEDLMVDLCVKMAATDCAEMRSVRATARRLPLR